MKKAIAVTDQKFNDNVYSGHPLPKNEKKFRTAYAVFHKEPTPVDPVSMTKQSFAEECDINNILKRFETTGEIVGLIKENPQYGDFSDALQYQEALDLVHHAHDQFDSLSSHVRERFKNDPYSFLDFCNNPENLPELEKMGLLKPRQPNDDKPIPSQNELKSTPSEKKPEKPKPDQQS